MPTLIRVSLHQLSQPEFLALLADNADRIMWKYFRPGIEIDKMMKPDDTPVTEADLEISAMLVDEFYRRFPGGKLLSEESGHGSFDGTGFAGWFDELDGTKRFAEGHPEAVFAGLLMNDGLVEHAIVHAPLFSPKRRFTASRERGAFENGAAIHVSPGQDGLTIIVGTAGVASELYKAEPIIRNLCELGHATTEMTSSCYAGALVACGEVDGVIFPWTTPHDAIADLIVREARGYTSDLYGNPLDFRKKEIRGYIMANSMETLAMLLETAQRNLRKK